MAPSTKKLFELPIKSQNATGSIICTEPQSKVYLLTFAAPPDNRLVTAVCQSLILALDIIEHRCPPGVVITTSSIKKFYSNGMDIEHSQFTPGYLPNSLYALWYRFLTYPRPTVALFNGHAFAGGLMLGMMHDYRIMNPHKGYLSLNELHLGMPLRPPMLSIFRQKVSPTTLRKMILEAHRYAALEALSEGLVDHIGELPEALQYIEEMKLVEKAQVGGSGRSVYGELKREMWRETVGLLRGWAEETVGDREARAMIRREKGEEEERVRRWEREGKAKL